MDIIPDFSEVQSTLRADAVILAAGDFPTHPIPLGMLTKAADRIICCDGAADRLLAAGFTPMAVVGDGDSISPEARERLSDRLHIESEQDTNDLSKAVRYAVSQGLRRLTILGATGRREDHTLGNISLLADYQARGLDVEMWTDYGIFTPDTGCQTFASRAGQQVSVFCLDDAPLTLRDVRWPLEGRRITRWWQATLNKALTDTFRIETRGRVIVFRTYITL